MKKKHRKARGGRKPRVSPVVMARDFPGMAIEEIRVARTEESIGTQDGNVYARNKALQSAGMGVELVYKALILGQGRTPIGSGQKGHRIEVLCDTTADASRVRLALEGSRAFEMGDGTLTPGLEFGVRHDGGDAETGTGVELGGRIAWSDPGTGLGVEARVRALVAHEDSKYREWGASGAVRLAPGERGRGLSFSLAPNWGTPGSGVDRLWSARDARGLAPNSGGDFEPESRLEGEFGYGLPVFGGRFTGTPNAGFALSDSSREVRIGWRMTSAAQGHSGFEVSLDATRREAANDTEASAAAGSEPEHGVMLRGSVRW